MTFHAIELGAEKAKRAVKPPASKDTLGTYAKVLSESAEKLLAVRAVLVAPLKQGKWNDYLEKLSAKWEKERQEYNKQARAFKQNMKAKHGDIPIIVVQSKDKANPVEVEGFGWIIPVAIAVAAIGVAAAGAWAVKGIAQAYLQHKRITAIDEEVRAAVAKLPPDQQAKYLTEMAKGKEAVAAAVPPPGEEKGVLDKIKDAWKGLTGGTQTALTLAGAGLLAVVGYNVYKGRRGGLGLAGGPECLRRWQVHLERMAAAGLLDRTRYVNEMARLVVKDCRLPYHEARTMVLKARGGR